MLARKLLAFHHKGEGYGEETGAIVAALTQDLYSHDYVITRKEAKGLLGARVSDCPEELEADMMALFQIYAEDLQLNSGFSPAAVVGGQQGKPVTLDRAFIESADKTYVFRTKKEIKKNQIKREGIPIELFQETVIEEGWTDSGVK
jgi:hypothetical protein